MIYLYDQALQLPTVDLYDTLMMAMALNAAKDMYERGELQIKDFLTKYADFMSPFQKDMDRYSQIVNGVLTAINDLYARGEDPLRSQVGRAKMGQILRSVNPAELAAMKANAKTGYAYLDAMQKLRSQGKYSEAQELFDIMTNGGTRMQDFATVGPNGFNSWDRVSPIEATTLRDLTYKNYEKRTPRVLNRSDFSDPRLQGYKYDPRYEYTGYLRSDLMKVAPGASLSLQGDPRAAFFREQARQAVIARGEEPTADAIERQFQEDIADANSWALVDPVRKADDFALQAQKAADARALENLRAKNDAEIAAIKAGNKEEGSGNFAHLLSNGTSSARIAMAGLMFKEYALKHPKAAGARLKELESLSSRILNETDPEKIAALEGTINQVQRKMDSESMSTFLLKRTADGKQSPYSILMTLGEGQSGVYAINDILKNRSINGDVELDPMLVLSRSGYSATDDSGWSKPGRAARRILSPHQLMTNILRFESGSGVKLREKRTGNIITQNDLIKKIEQSAKGEGLLEASTNARLSRTDEILSLNEYISAPDENGVYHVYMKVAIKQGARLLQPGSWLPQGEHDGFWLETFIGLNPDGTISTESNPSVFGAGLRQRKEFTNAASTEEYSSIRY